MVNELRTATDHYTINLRIHKVEKAWVADQYNRSGGGSTSAPVSEATRSTDEVVTVTVRAKTLEAAIDKATKYLDVEKGNLETPAS